MPLEVENWSSVDHTQAPSQALCLSGINPRPHLLCLPGGDNSSASLSGSLGVQLAPGHVYIVLSPILKETLSGESLRGSSFPCLASPASAVQLGHPPLAGGDGRRGQRDPIPELWRLLVIRFPEEAPDSFRALVLQGDRSPRIPSCVEEEGGRGRKPPQRSASTAPGLLLEKEPPG